MNKDEKNDEFEIIQKEITPSIQESKIQDPLSGDPLSGNKKINPQPAKDYKVLFQKSRRLVEHYEKELNKLKLKVSTLNSQLKECKLEEGKKYELIFKFKYESSIFYLFQTEEGQLLFINENSLEENFKNKINSEENLKTYDYSLDLKARDETINQIITQYDERIIRLKTENEVTEKKISTLNDKNKNAAKDFEEYKTEYKNEIQKFEDSIKLIIQTSSDLSNQIKNTLDVDLRDDNFRFQIYEEIQNSIKKSFKSKDNLLWIQELMSLMTQTFTELEDQVFKYIALENSIYNQKEKWQATLNQIVLSNEEEINNKLQVIENHKQHINKINQKLSALESEKYNIAREKDQTIEILNKELNRGVNINYLRNIMISFLTTKDVPIQNKLLPVIFTTLQFTENEIKKVNEFRGEKGFLSYLFK